MFIHWVLNVLAGLAVPFLLYVGHKVRKATKLIRLYLGTPQRVHEMVASMGSMVESIDEAGARLVSAAWVLERTIRDLKKILDAAGARHQDHTRGEL